jgi:hypothetical protein
MPCTVEIDPGEELQHVTVMLCQAFKHLSPSQIDECRNYGSFIDGLEWYTHHLLCDFSYNLKIGNEPRLVAITEELHRIGYGIVGTDGGMALQELKVNT